jgi:hypothetical protein
MNVTRYFMLGILAFMAIAAISIFAYRIASPSRSRLEVGGVVPYLSILGVLGFLAGAGLLVYDEHRFSRLGLGLVALALLAMVASYFIAQKKARRRPDA